MLGAVSIPAPLQSLFALSWQVQSLSRQAVNITCSCFYSDLLSNVSKCTWTDFKNSQKCFTWLRTWPSTKTSKVLNHHQLHEAWLNIWGRAASSPQRERSEQKKKSEEPSGNSLPCRQLLCRGCGWCTPGKMSRVAPVSRTPAKLHTPVFCELEGVVFFTITCEQLRDLATTLTPPTEPLPQLLSLSH